MNNINQKNVILNLKHEADMPYRSTEYVNQFQQCESITNADINNAARQLLDNDLYIENYLNTTSSYTVGPKPNNNLDQAPDGYKVYGSLQTEETLDILRKQEDPLSATIFKIDNTNANFVAYWSDMVFIGFENKPMKYSFASDISTFFTFPICATNFYSDDNRIVFSATDGVYQLSSSIVDDESSEDYGQTEYGVVRLNSNTLTNLRSVHINRSRQKIIVGGSTCVYEGDYNLSKSPEQMYNSISFESQLLVNEDDDVVSQTVNALGSTANTDIAGGNGMYLRKQQYSYQNCQIIYQHNSDESKLEKQYYVIASFNGQEYTGADNGLFVINGNSINKAEITGTAINDKVIDIKVDDNLMYIATQKAVYTVNKQLVCSANYLNMALPENRIPSTANISKLLVCNNQVHVATDNGLYCFRIADNSIYINEICTNGAIRSLPASDDSLRFKNIIDICVKSNIVLVGTTDSITRFDFTGYSSCDTQVISKFESYVDQYGKKINSGKILKLLRKDDSDVYIVTQNSICNSNALELAWKTPNQNETISDACIAKISGETRIFVTTNKDTYILSLASGTSPSVVAKPKTAIPGIAVAVTYNVIMVAASSTLCKYVYNSIDSFSKSDFKEYSCSGLNQLDSADDSIYYRTSGIVNQLPVISIPQLNTVYSGNSILDYAWSTVQNGYVFVNNNILYFKGLTHTIESGEECEPEVTVNVLNDVVWYNAKKVTSTYVDNAKNIIYVGTETTLLSASLVDSTGAKISKPVFAECACQTGSSFGNVNCICQGFPTGYVYGEYTSLVEINSSSNDESLPTHIENHVKISSNDSVLVATDNGLFELKTGATQFSLIYSTKKYKAIYATPMLFVGITKESSGDSYIHSIVNTFSDVEKTGTGIKIGTENETIKYTEHTVTTTGFTPRISTTAVVPSSIRSLKVFSEETNTVIYAAGGKNSVIKNIISNENLGTFDFNATSYGYIQSLAEINAVQPPEDRHIVTWQEAFTVESDYYEDSETGEYTERLYKKHEDLTYDPICEIFFDKPDGYSDYILYSAGGVYTVDTQNITVASAVRVKTGEGNDIAAAKLLRNINGMLYIICGTGEGLQTTNHTVTKKEFLVDDLFSADGLYYIKQSGKWSYMTSQVFSAATTVENNTSLEPVFSAFGIGNNENCQFLASSTGIVYIGTETKGLGQVYYFSTQVANYNKIDVPAGYSSGFNTSSLNPASESENIIIVKQSNSKYEIYKYDLLTNSMSLVKYTESSTNDEISQFNIKPVFINKDGSNKFYTVIDSGLYYGQFGVLHSMPKFSDEFSFSNINYAYSGSHIMLAGNKSIFTYDSVGNGIVWGLIDSDVGEVRKICGTSDGRCLFTTSNGLWYYAEIDDTGTTDIYGECIQLRAIDDDGAYGLCKYIVDSNENYVYSQKKTIYSSGNYKRWKLVLEWTYLKTGAATGIDTINSICKINDRTYFASADNGVYMTKYCYEMVQDNKAFTKDDALAVYDELMQTQISADVSAMISDHISSASGWHAENAIVTRLNNNYLNTDLDNITDWSSSELCNDTLGYIDTKNDIIEEMYFGKYTDGDIAVEVSNFLMQEPSHQTGISYISKVWRSGVTEIYVSIPTTSSYYIANCFGASNCRHNQQDSYQRKNLEQFGSNIAVQDSVLSTHWTSVSVCVASASYNIDNVLDVQINGMSLPLAVYKDQTSNGDTGLAGKLYRSYIEPSTLRKYDITKTDDDGNYIFEFACFGTDAQAVKLMFYDKNAYSMRECVKIVFDANGGEGTMQNQKFVITYDAAGKTILEQKMLRKCLFTNTSSGHTKVFSGWSVLPLADNSSATYEDRTAFPKYTSGQTFEDLMEELGDPTRTKQLQKNEEIRLYAVWLDYEFSDTDTTFMMQSDKTDFYIDSVGIDTSTKLGNNVIINFGD